MGALTDNCPKPLLVLSNGETLLESKLHALPSHIKKVALVVGYLGGMIEERIGKEYEGKEVVYVEQNLEKAYGTGAALFLCKEHIPSDGSVLVLMGDDIYDKDDLTELCQHENAILLAHKGEEKFGASWQVRVEDGKLAEFYEKVPEEHLRTGIINTGAYVLSPSYFEIEPVIGGDGEIQIPPTIAKLLERGIIFSALKARFWKQVTAPEDLSLS